MHLVPRIAPNTYDEEILSAPRDGLQAALQMMSGVLEEALAADIWLLHPADVQFVRGRARISLSPLRPERSPSMAPEVTRSGPVPATLSFAAAAIAALAALGTLEPPPDAPELHRLWRERLGERLRNSWAGLAGVDHAVELIVRCLSFEPSLRPSPNRLVEDLATLRALLQRLPAVTETPVSSRSSTGARPLPKPRPRSSHPLAPYAVATVILAALALAIALCTLGAVLGRFADLMTRDLLEPVQIAPAPTNEQVELPPPMPEAPPEPPPPAASTAPPAPAAIQRPAAPKHEPTGPLMMER